MEIRRASGGGSLGEGVEVVNGDLVIDDPNKGVVMDGQRLKIVSDDGISVTEIENV